MTQISAGQSLLDVCLQELGDISALFDLADANGLAITDALAPGQVLNVPASLLGREEVAVYFSGKGMRVNTNYDFEILIAIPPVAPNGYFHHQFFNPQYFK